MPPLMSTTGKTAELGLKYPAAAYQFVDASLRYVQKRRSRTVPPRRDADDEAHVSGEELLEGVRELAIRQFGLMTITVFRHWGVHSTGDFGKIVFELIDRGIMRKTDRDQLTDFFDVYDFADAFDRDYRIDVMRAFEK